MHNQIKWHGILSYILISLYGMTLLYMPYSRGLFFDQDIYIYELFLVVLFLGSWVISYRNETIKTFKSWIVLLQLSIIGIYFISGWFGSTPLLSTQSSFRMFTYGIVFIGLLTLLNRKRSRYLHHYLFLSIAWVGIYGLLAQYKIVEYPSAILNFRIASVLQYPNTLASLLAALVIGVFMYGSRASTKWYFRLGYLTLVLPSLVVFIYTQSRATLLIFPLIWLVGLLFLNVRQQIYYFLSTLVIGGSLIPILLRYENYLADHNIKIIGIIFGLGLIIAIILTGLFWMIERIKASQRIESLYSRLIIPSVLVIMGIFGFSLLQNPSFIEKLPEMLQGRLAQIDFEQRSLIERLAFFQDSFNLFKQNWLIGTGGNGWKGLYMSVQSLPYISSQTHSFPMGVLVEIGVLGTLAFLSFIGIILVTMFRWIRKHGLRNERLIDIGIPFTMALMLFVHSIVDFDMAYGYYALVWFTLLAMVYVEVREEDTELKVNFSKLQNGNFAKYMIWGTTTLSIIVLIFIGRYAYAESIKLEDVTYEQALTKIDKKIKYMPSNTEFRFIRMDILEGLAINTNQEGYINKLLDEGVRITEIDKYDPVSLLRVAQYLAKYGYGLDGIAYTKQALDVAPWFLPAYEQYIAFTTQVGLQQLQSGKTSEGLNHIQSAIEKMDTIEAKRAELDELPPTLRYPTFQFTPEIRRFGGQALIMNGDYDRALRIMEPILNNANETIKFEALLWSSLAAELNRNHEKAEQYAEEGRALFPHFDNTLGDILIFLMNLN